MKTKRFEDSGRDKTEYKSKAKLKKMLLTMNIVTIARKCGVAPAAVMYYVKKYKLTHEKKRSKRLKIRVMTITNEQGKVKVKKIYDEEKIFRINRVRSRKHYDLDPWEDFE